MSEDLDAIDRGIIHALQEDARNTSSADIAERVGTSSSTVRKRIQRLEERGVIRGYRAEVDYKKVGYPYRMLLFCTAPIPRRGELVVEIMGIDCVVSVQELISGEHNILVTAVAETDDEITPVAQQLFEMGVRVSDEVLVRRHETLPFEDFAPE